MDPFFNVKSIFLVNNNCLRFELDNCSIFFYYLLESTTVTYVTFKDSLAFFYSRSVSFSLFKTLQTYSKQHMI